MGESVGWDFGHSREGTCSQTRHKMSHIVGRGRGLVGGGGRGTEEDGEDHMVKTY